MSASIHWLVTDRIDKVLARAKKTAAGAAASFLERDCQRLPAERCIHRGWSAQEKHDRYRRMTVSDRMGPDRRARVTEECISLSSHDQLFQLSLQKQEQHIHAYREGAVEVFFSLIHEHPVVPGYSGTVECIVDPSEGLESQRYDEPALIGLSEIRLDEFRRAAVAINFADYSLPFSQATFCDDNVCAQLRQTFPGHSANPASPASDKR
jgi:hypothetical protein